MSSIIVAPMSIQDKEMSISDYNNSLLPDIISTNLEHSHFQSLHHSAMVGWIPTVERPTVNPVEQTVVVQLWQANQAPKIRKPNWPKIGLT